MRAAGAGLTLVLLASMALPAQTTTPAPPPDRVTFDVAGGVSRYGRHGFGGLEVAMNRWWALRTEALFGQDRQRENGLYYRSAALSLTNVLTYDRNARLTPYVFGGVSLAARVCGSSSGASSRSSRGARNGRRSASGYRSGCGGDR
jgi:hypothetical protein